MHEQLAGYLAVLGVTGSSANARLVAGQFHDVVVAGEVACRFPRDEESRRRLPAAVARWLRLAGLAWLYRFRWAPATSEARSAAAACR